MRIERIEFEKLSNNAITSDFKFNGLLFSYDAGRLLRRIADFAVITLESIYQSHFAHPGSWRRDPFLFLSRSTLSQAIRSQQITCTKTIKKRAFRCGYGKRTHRPWTFPPRVRAENRGVSPLDANDGSRLFTHGASERG